MAAKVTPRIGGLLRVGHVLRQRRVIIVEGVEVEPHHGVAELNPLHAVHVSADHLPYALPLLRDRQKFVRK